ncbi:MAG: hypothetical protein GY760_18580 [Deltaproteobacteria bacterium]|nr:hypothetical protein [Deltaproteobacteria bacterium]
MALNVVEKIDDLVKVNNVLISVSDKTGLDNFIPELVKINPEITIFSTGGTYNKICDILGNKDNVVQVSDYTGQPETQGGLVKTLDFKIYLGILTETYNDDHQNDLKRTSAKAIDMVIVNLYPFASTIAKDGVTVEEARSNIDIGGPTMIRASAKNYLRVASVVNPDSYSKILSELKESDGCTSLSMRYNLARESFEHTAVYDRTIADFLFSKSADDAKGCYFK